MNSEELNKINRLLSDIKEIKDLLENKI